MSRGDGRDYYGSILNMSAISKIEEESMIIDESAKKLLNRCQDTGDYQQFRNCIDDSSLLASSSFQIDDDCTLRRDQLNITVNEFNSFQNHEDVINAKSLHLTHLAINMRKIEIDKNSDQQQTCISQEPLLQIDLLLQQRFLNLVSKIQTKLKPLINSLSIPEFIPNMTDEVFSKMTDKDQALITNLAYEDIDFNVIEMSIKQGFVKSYSELEYLLSRLILQRTNELFKMFQDIRGDHDTLYVWLRQKLIAKIQYLIMKNKDKRQILKEVLQLNLSNNSQVNQSLSGCSVRQNSICDQSLIQNLEFAENMSMGSDVSWQAPVQNLDYSFKISFVDKESLSGENDRQKKKKQKRGEGQELTLMTMNFNNLFKTYRHLVNISENNAQK
eukprot:403330662